MVEVAARAARAGTVSAVLDCEIVAFDPAASRILPFQVRARLASTCQTTAGLNLCIYMMMMFITIFCIYID